MAQRAFVSRYDRIMGTETPGQMQIMMQVQLLEEAVTEPQIHDLVITTAWTETNAQIKSKIVAEILRIAQENNYTQLTSGNVILPTYAKG